MKMIVYATDGSENAVKALDLACDLATAKNAQLAVVHVQRRQGSATIPPEMMEYERLENMRATEGELMRTAAEQILADAAMKAERNGVGNVETHHLIGDPTHQIVEFAHQSGADAIVMGSRGLGDLQGLFMGSVSHKVAHAAPCTCIVVR